MEQLDDVAILRSFWYYYLAYYFLYYFVALLLARFILSLFVRAGQHERRVAGAGAGHRPAAAAGRALDAGLPRRDRGGRSVTRSGWPCC